MGRFKNAFEQAFRLAAGHTLREVRRHERDGPHGVEVEREHEERDAQGRLVSVYESWTQADGTKTYVKYSPSGMVLARSDRAMASGQYCGAWRWPNWWLPDGTGA